MISNNELLTKISTEKPLEKPIDETDNKITNQDEILKETTSSVKKKKKKRCAECKKKLKHIILKCKCSSKKFCMNCAKPDNHNCTFDHVGEYRKKLAEQNPLVNFSKLDKL